MVLDPCMGILPIMCRNITKNARIVRNTQTSLEEIPGAVTQLPHLNPKSYKPHEPYTAESGGIAQKESHSEACIPENSGPVHAKTNA